MPSEHDLPALPIDDASSKMLLRGLRERVLVLLRGQPNAPDKRAVRVADLVKLGLITQEQADDLVRAG